MSGQESYAPNIVFFGVFFGILVYVSTAYEATTFALLGLFVFLLGFLTSSIYKRDRKTRAFSTPNDNIKRRVKQIAGDMDISVPKIYQHTKSNIGFHRPRYSDSDIIVIGKQSTAEKQRAIIAHELAHVRQSNLIHMAYLLSIPFSGAVGVILGPINLQIGVLLPTVILTISTILYCHSLRKRELDADMYAASYIGIETYVGFIPRESSKNGLGLFSSRPSNDQRIEYIKNRDNRQFKVS